MRSRIPPSTARRIDHLARRAHRFHRFAHHPLCVRYAGELIAVGRARICRGCACAAAGGIAGAILGLLGPAPTGVAVVAALTSGALLSWRSVAPRGRRRPKLLTRALPAALLSGTVASGLRAADAPGAWVALAAVVLLLVTIARYRRRRPDRSACEGCAERGADVCSGFRRIARREAAFARLAGRWIAAEAAVRR